MSTQGFTLFDTAIGRCAIAWGARGVLGVQLPEARELATRTRMRARFPSAVEVAPPPDVARARDAIVALFRGEAERLDAIALDMEGVPPFHRRVYEVARNIDPGTTVSYGEIAKRLGKPGSARAVGQALGKNPFAIIVPCHRVLAAGGKLGGFSANGGIATKQRMLALERAKQTLDTNRAKQTLAETDERSESQAELLFDLVHATEHLCAVDPTLARLIERAGALDQRRKQTASVFTALSEAIVYQQLNGKAAATIYARLCALFPSAQLGPSPRQILRASDERLRSAGLSRNKLLSLRDLAQRCESGSLPSLAEIESLDDASVIERLSEVRGIGRWTAEMFLMFRLGRPDVLPVDDYGIRQGFKLAWKKRELPSREALAKYGARWKPYRTLASCYLWRAVDLARAR